MFAVQYNVPGVIVMGAREYAKALIDRLSDEQVQALQVILEAMALPEAELSPEEEADIEEGLADLEAGRKVSAEDVWKELGI